MITKIIKCYFTTPVHIGTSREDYTESKTFIHSDTLYAAMLQMWALMGEQSYLEGIANKGGQPPFTLSSMFPFYRKEKTSKEEQQQPTVYFLPRPFRPFDGDLNTLDFYQ